MLSSASRTVILAVAATLALAAAAAAAEAGGSGGAAGAAASGGAGAAADASSGGGGAGEDKAGGGFTAETAQGAAAGATPPAVSAWDPFETINRATFKFNSMFSSDVSQPVANAYRQYVPTAVQNGLDNAFTNLREPLTAVSSAVQGDFHNAGASAGRFAINMTAGIFGLIDVATEAGWVSRSEDIGSTLCTYGVRPGPYIVIPFLGPATVREAVGMAGAYAFAYNTAPGGHGWNAIGYISTDRVVASLSAKRPPSPGDGDPYIRQRDGYLALRQDICSHKIPPGQLKGGPIGIITRVVPADPPQTGK
jgi:phospholipid-binding lipoprotein MlaA